MELFEHLHPKLVHFPIAFFVGAWILLVLSQLVKKEQLYKAATYVYVMAAFSSVLTAASGLWEADHLHLQHPVLYAHRNYAIATLVVSWAGLLMAWLRRRDPHASRLTFIFAVWLCAGLVLIASYFGGEMVYDYGIGVER